MRSAFKAAGRVAALAFLLVAAGASTPESASAQSRGCPWCTTPTTCAEVLENTNIGGCYNIGNGCEEISGSCTIQPERMLAADRQKLFEASGVRYLGTATVSLLGADIEASAVDDGLYAQWSCNGVLTALFTKTDSGEWEELDPAPYRKRLNLKVAVVGLTD